MVWNEFGDIRLIGIVRENKMNTEMSEMQQWYEIKQRKFNIMTNRYEHSLNNIIFGHDYVSINFSF